MTSELAVFEEAVELAIRDEWPAEIEVRLADLTARQRRFCLEYIIDFNQAAAAVRAGYSENSVDSMASRLIRHPKIGPLIADMANLSAEQLGVSRAYVISKLRQLADAAEADGDRHAATRALELLAKLRGDMIERRQVDVRTVAITINDVEMEDLR